MNKLSLQHKWILAIIGVVLINVFVWIYGLAPALDKITAARADLQRSEGEKQSLQRRLVQLNSIDSLALEEDLELYNVLIPEKGLMREFIAELESRADRLGVNLESIALSEPSPQDPYLLTEISLNISGDYAPLISYIKELEGHERLLFLDNFNLSDSEEGLRCPINMVIFAENFDPVTPYDAPGRDNPFRE